jgi:hypothetical protein
VQRTDDIYDGSCGLLVSLDACRKLLWPVGDVVDLFRETFKDKVPQFLRFLDGT